MHGLVRWAMAVALVALPVTAQNNIPDLAQAQQVLTLADGAGAQQYAKSLYDDAAYRIRFAQENMNSTKTAVQEQARMRAREALFAARAALAKARWLGTNAVIRNLQGDINRFGGRSNLVLQDEDVNVDFHRGSTTKDRINTAQSAIDRARAAGAEQSVPDNELATAQSTLESARKVSRNGRDQSDVADHLAYIAEMTGRRAYYLARFNESARIVPGVQLERTRLAQLSSEQQAASERTQRQEAEQRAAELQRQLGAQEANRQAQAAELERLRHQVDENRRAMQQRIENDRAARIEAERRLDDAMSRYEAAMVAGTPDVDTLRRQVEDAEIALRAVQERERLNQQAMDAEITTLRTDIQSAQSQPDASAAVIAQRQADLIRRQTELDAYRKEIQDDSGRRADVQRRHELAITAAQQQRQQAEAQAQAMRQQMEQAQQAAQQAAQAAQAAQQQAQQTQQQLQTAQQQTAQTQQQLQTLQQQAQQTQQQLQQQAQQSQAEAEKARQQAAAAQAELQRTREELAKREAEGRRQQMEAELAKLAKTRTETNRFIVTLPGIFFDTGKTQLKAGAKSTLAKIAAQLKSDQTIRISVEGHTDNVGKAEKNQELSQKRAEAVRDFLVSQGVAADRITATGKGQSEPIATNKTVAGRQQNRRVELVISM